MLSSDLGVVTTIPAGSPAPAVAAPIEIPVKGIRKVVAERMMASLTGAAQLTLSASADATSRCLNAYTMSCIIIGYLSSASHTLV